MNDKEKNLIQVYCETHSSAEPIHLQELTKYTRLNTTNPRMVSGHLQGRFLSFLSSIVRPKCILELGTFTGYSALCLSEGLAENGTLHTIEANPENAYKAQQWLDKHAAGKNIQLHVGEAAAVIPTLNIQPEMIFVDADKINYPLYLKLCHAILPKAGMLIFDNTLWDGKVTDEELRQKNTDTRRMHEFNELLLQYEDLEIVMLPLRDGLTVARKKSASEFVQ